jgi:hypothetical protein
MTESREEAVVDKTARVVEEVVVSKDVDQTTETVRDTVRHTDVNVEEMNRNTGMNADMTSRTDYETGYRSNYDTNYANSGYSYEQYTPAYRYGAQLANDSQYRDRDWSSVENDARTRWDERNPGTWDQFKGAVRHAWDEVRGRA